MRNLFVIFLVVTLSSCFVSEEWTLFYFKNYESLPSGPANPEEFMSEKFSSHTACSTSARNRLRSAMVQTKTSKVSDYYLCGLNCEKNERGILICERYSKNP